MKNILFLGLGSIGQRHLRNLKKLKSNLNFYAIRRKKNSPLLDNNNNIIKKKFILSENNVKNINFNQIKRYKIDTAFITNPSSKHLSSAIKIGGLGCNLFIEKPLSHNMNNISILKEIIKKKKILCAVGYQTRYDDLLLKIKKIIKKKNYGNILSVNIHNRHYLPFHHRYEDYKIGYAAQKKLGGGVLLCFIHEIDYANYLFEKPLKVFGKSDKKSNLIIDVEDTAKFTVIYDINKKEIPVNFHLDFIKKKTI